MEIREEEEEEKKAHLDKMWPCHMLRRPVVFWELREDKFWNLMQWR
jgi:hypothetical protein